MEEKPRVRAGAVMIRGKHILLMGRFRNGRVYYTFPGGGVEAGETPRQTVVREIQEEFTLTIKPGQLLFQYATPRKIEFFYLVQNFRGDPVIGGEEKEMMSERNRYFPAWRPVTDLAAIRNLYPENARIVIGQKLSDFLSRRRG